MPNGSAPSDAPADRRVLYLRWRPSTFDDVVGQEHVVRTLRNAVASGRLAHAYLFAGPRGTGKTSVARILFKAANCLDPRDGNPCDACAICSAANSGRSLDLIEMDAASNRGIDDIRSLRERIHFSPVEARYRVYIVDEAHELTRDAWDAFLKTLEEPPPHVIFVLATTEAHRVPATISSRCQRFDFRRLPLETVRAQVDKIAVSEGLRVDGAALDSIASLANGGLRDAIGLLDQLRAYCGNEISEEAARSALGLPAAGTSRAILEQLRAGELAAALETLDQTVQQGVDARLLADELLDHVRGLLFAGLRASHALEAQMGREAVGWMETEAPKWRRENVLTLARGLSDAVAKFREATRLRLELELLFAEHARWASAGAEEVDDVQHPAEPAPRAPEDIDTEVDSSEVAQPTSTRPHRGARAAAGAERSKQAGPSAAETPEAPSIGPSEQEAAASPAVSMEQIRRHWPGVVERVTGQNGPLGAVLDAVQPIQVVGGTLTLGVPYAFHVRMVADPRNRRVVEDAWAAVLGCSLRVECVSTQDTNPGPPVLVSSEDPVVLAALEIFGGEVTLVEEDGPD